MRLFRDSESGSGLRRSESGGGTGNKLVSKVARAILPAGMMRDKAAKERPQFNPEDHISEKRAWSRRYMAAGSASDRRRASTAAAEQHLFEHFAVVGLPPNTNIRSVASDIKTYQRLNRQAGGGDGAASAATGLHITADTPREERQRQYGLKGPALQAEVLCSFPPPSMPPELSDSLAAFCFPHGVRPELLERTPSMSALNEIIYSQPYQTHDDQSFVFLMKVVDPGSVAPRTLYGVCCYVRELVHRPPSMAKEAFPTCNAPLNRYLVVAPRCYCLLTHHPFFALHFRVLQTILGLERLERMTSFSAELAAMELGGGRPHASPPYSASSPSRVTSSGGGPASSASSQSASASAANGSGSQQGWPAPASAATSLAVAAATAAAADDPLEEAASESGSSRRWTEGSSYCADEPPLLPLPLLQLPAQPRQQQELQQQPGDGQAGGMLLQTQGTVDGQQQQQQQRPSHPGQVSPYCPPPVVQPQHGMKPAAADASPLSQAAAAAEATVAVAGRDAAAAAQGGDGGDTPTFQVVTSAWGSAAGTPFFTPAGPSSAVVCSPASRSSMQHLEQQSVGLQAAAGLVGAGRGDVCRALEQSLGEVGGGGSSGGRVSGSSSTGSSRPGSTSGDEHADEEVLEGGQSGEHTVLRVAEQRIESAINSPTGSRPGSRQSAGFFPAAASDRGAADDGEDGTSEAGSYLTASSSTVLLGQLADGSPAPPAGPAGMARLSPFTQSMDSALVNGAAEGSPPAAVLGLHELSSQQQAHALLPQEALQPQQEAPQQQQEEEVLPTVAPLPDLDQQPLLVLEAAQKVVTNGSDPLPAQHTQQDEQPLSQLDGAAALVSIARAEDQQQEQQQEQQHKQLPAQEAVQPQALQPAQQQVQQQAQQPAHSGARGVHIATTSINSLSLAATHADANTPPRADLLTGGTGATRSRRQLAPLQLHSQAGGGSSNGLFEAGGDGGQGGLPADQRQQQPQQQEQEVVRVTATNVDMSRPLRSRDLLATYYASIVPRPGQVFEFQPDPGLQTIAFERPDLVEAVAELGLRPDAATLPDIDAAQNLGGWAVAALCRSMSLDNVFTFLTAALLERQMVVFCPNAGLLSGIVLSIVPLLLPFHWQCLLLPVLPAGEGRLELIEAPVPFVLGVMYKTSEVRSKCGQLVRVNVYKDKIKNAGGLPALPQQQALHDALAGTYAELRKIGLTRAATTRPVHLVSDAQQVLAECFLSTLQKYFKGLMADLRAYCITDVSASMERTSVLLKDSFVDSFPTRDRTFMRQFTETQMFSVYSDAVMG